MNCQEKIKQLKELEKLHQELKEKYETLKETGNIPDNFWQLEEELEEDIKAKRETFRELLEKYFGEWGRWEDVGREKFGADIYTICPLGENLGKNKFLVGGGDSTLKVLIYNPSSPKDSEWEDANGEKFGEWINTIYPLGKNKFLVGGYNSTLKVLNYNPSSPKHSKWDERKIGKKKFGTEIETIYPLGKNKFLVGGGKGTLKVLTYNPSSPKDSEWEDANGEGFGTFIESGNRINTVSPLGKNKFLVGGVTNLRKNKSLVRGDKSTLKILSFNSSSPKHSKWEDVNGEEFGANFGANIFTIFPLGKNKFLVGGAGSTLKLLSKELDFSKLKEAMRKAKERDKEEEERNNKK